jgi:hypothetical protein
MWSAQRVSLPGVRCGGGAVSLFVRLQEAGFADATARDRPR